MRRVLFASVIFLLFATSAIGEHGEFTSVSDYAFNPTDDEGYIQAWNIDFRGGGRYIYLTFLVSNTGPGSLNNGVSVLIYGKDEKTGQITSRIWTGEYSVKSLSAKPGQFGHKSGPNSIQMDGGSFVIHAENPGGSPSPAEPLKMDLRIQSISPGVRISGGNLAIRGGNLLRADIPVTSGVAKLTLQVGDKTETLSGIAGLESIWADKSPHTYAKRFLLARSFSADKGIFLGGYFGIGSITSDFLLRYAITEKGQLKIAGPVKAIEIISSQPDGFSGYTIPIKVKYKLSDSCSMMEERRYFAGGFDVLGSVSTFLRWVLRVFFAKPYVMHYDSKLTYSCVAKEGAAPIKDISADVQSSYYLINP